MTYRLAKRAEADLEDIAYYIAKEARAWKPPGVSSSPSRTDFNCLGPIPTPAELETTI